MVMLTHMAVQTRAGWCHHVGMKIDPTTSADEFGPGTFGCHEALHLAHVFADLVERQLVEHPAVQSNTRWHVLAMQAASALAKLYQEIGAVHLGAPNPSCPVR